MHVVWASLQLKVEHELKKKNRLRAIVGIF